jgi:predicted transcriptional regulator
MVNKKTTLAKKIRQSKVIDYKLAGWSNVKIGELLSVTPSMVSRDVKESLQKTEDAWDKNTQKVRLLQSERLERLLTKYYKKAFDGDGDMESAEFSRKVIKDLRELWGADLTKNNINIDARQQTVVWDKDESPNDLLEDKIKKYIARNNRTNTDKTSTDSN